VVTGANRGIGLATTRTLAQQDFTVVMCARDPAAGAAAHKSLVEEGLSVALRKLDITHSEETTSLAKWLWEQFGHVDVLINNAGILLESHKPGAKHSADPMQVSMSTLLEHFNVNTLGAVRMIQAIAPLMSSGGRIVNLSSGMGQLSDMDSGRLGYRLSKAALNAATRVYANELADQGIGVYAVCPGWVRTRMGGKSATRSPEEGADTAVWLAASEPAPESGLFYRNRKPIAW
jgi:NAD(P)-dependent dehydrogenase (short-subunit alcohol dehydrogenase family)